MATNVHRRFEFRAVRTSRTGYWLILGLLGLTALIGGAAALTMEHAGHAVTGMTNRVVWGTPHVFAVFLIVAASGALNVASISSVFEKSFYQPLARLSGLLAISLLAGGLAVLVLDLGRPDRLIVAMTNINPRSIFSWNVILYTGFFAIVGVYLWTMLSRRAGRFYKTAAYGAFLWRLVLTTGTGSIFGFLVAREAYDAAILAPLFIAWSFAFGKAAFILVLMAVYGGTGRPIGTVVLQRLQRLMGIVLAASLYFLIVFHITNIYAAEHRAFETWLLTGGGIYTVLFWGGVVLLGGIIPLYLLLAPSLGGNIKAIRDAAVLIIIGGLCAMYVVIVGGQVWPMELFPGQTESSIIADGIVASYTPSVPEVLLGLGGIAVALIVLTIGVAAFRILPSSLADATVDPDHVYRKALEAEVVATPAE